MYSVTALFLHRNPGHNVKTTLIKTIVKVKVKGLRSALGPPVGSGAHCVRGRAPEANAF